MAKIVIDGRSQYIYVAVMNRRQSRDIRNPSNDTMTSSDSFPYYSISTVQPAGDAVTSQDKYQPLQLHHLEDSELVYCNWLELSEFNN